MTAKTPRVYLSGLMRIPLCIQFGRSYSANLYGLQKRLSGQTHVNPALSLNTSTWSLSGWRNDAFMSRFANPFCECKNSFYDARGVIAHRLKRGHNCMHFRKILPLKPLEIDQKGFREERHASNSKCYCLYLYIGYLREMAEYTPSTRHPPSAQHSELPITVEFLQSWGPVTVAYIRPERQPIYAKRRQRRHMSDTRVR